MYGTFNEAEDQRPSILSMILSEYGRNLDGHEITFGAFSAKRDDVGAFHI